MASNDSIGLERGRYPHSVMQDINFECVKITDPFWLERLKIAQYTTLPELLDLAETQGKIENFRIVSGRTTGHYRPYNAADSDVYKLIEAASYSLASNPDAGLRSRIDAIVADIAAAQQPDGYLNTQFSLPANHPAAPLDKTKFVKTFGFGSEHRWSSSADNWPFGYSQLYCAGHLMEAAVAHHRATGDRTFLNVAIRNADHLLTVFTPEKIERYSDHPEVEIGLMRLYEVTGNRRYVELADAITRHCDFSRPPDLNRTKNRPPLEHQREAVGHAVRTAYVYAGASSVVRQTGAGDLKTALFALWRDIVSSKMYVHGGTGNGTIAEQHGHAFDLPIGQTYSETCAAIAELQFNQELNLLTGESRFADVIEHQLWNNALAGISLDGETFFYSNKLNMGANGRKDQHSGVRTKYLFCCPSKVPALLTGVGRWTYATDEKGLVVNQFIGSELKTVFNGEPLELSMQSELPWNGAARLMLKRAPAQAMAIRLRIPAWARGTGPIPESPYRYDPAAQADWHVRVNGQDAASKLDADGYFTLLRSWTDGDLIEFKAAMPIRRIRTDDAIRANYGRVAISRGPVLFCLEGVDHTNMDVNELDLSRSEPIRFEFDPTLLGGMGTLCSTGSTRDGRRVPIKAIPYFAWQNRGISSLCTLLVEDRSRIEPEKTADPTPVNTDG